MVSLYKALYVVAILMDNTESWMLIEEKLKHLKLRCDVDERLLKISWTERVSNEEIYLSLDRIYFKE